MVLLPIALPVLFPESRLRPSVIATAANGNSQPARQADNRGQSYGARQKFVRPVHLVLSAAVGIAGCSCRSHVVGFVPVGRAAVTGFGLFACRNVRGLYFCAAGK